MFHAFGLERIQEINKDRETLCLRTPTRFLASDATDAEIKRVYRKLARHPDRNPGDEAKRFKSINPLMMR